MLEPVRSLASILTPRPAATGTCAGTSGCRGCEASVTTGGRPQTAAGSGGRQAHGSRHLVGG